MPIAWKPKINKLWEQVEEKEEEIEELSAWESIERFIPWTMQGVSLRRGEQAWLSGLERRKETGVVPSIGEQLKAEATKGVASLFPPTPEEFKEYSQLPLREQLRYEAPSLALSVIVPTAAVTRAGLIARGGKAAQVAAAAIKPIAVAEAVPAKIIGKVAEKVVRGKVIKQLTLELQNQLPHNVSMGLKPKDQTKLVRNIATELADWIGQISKQKIKSPGEYAKEAAWVTQTLRDRLKGRVSSYVTKSSRPERLLEMMDGFKEGGKMWKIFYEPLDASIQNALRKSLAGMDAVTKLGDRIVPGGGIQALRNWGVQPIGIKLGKVNLTRLDKVVINLYMRQKTAMSHLPHTYGLKSQSPKVFVQLQKIADSLTPEEKMVADTMGRIVRFQQRATQDAFRYSYGKEMVLEPNWFPVKVMRDALSDIGWRFSGKTGDQKLARIMFGGVYPSAKTPKGFTRPRSGRAIEALDRNIIDVLLAKTRDIAYFSQVQPVVMDLQKLLGKSVQSKQLAVAIKQTHGNATYKVLQKYLTDSASPRLALPTNEIEKIFRFMRTNTVVAVLGLNLISAMKQFPSFILGSTRTGYKPAAKGIMSYLRDPKRIDMLLKKYRPELYLRGKAMGAAIERELGEITEARAVARGAAKVYWTVKDTSMALIRTTDRLAIRGLWAGAFDDAVQKGMSDPKAAAYASKIIRQTQPYFSAKDLAHYWRGGEPAKMLTVFTNQLNQNFNYILYDIIGRYQAGVIGKTKVLERVMMGIVAQGLLIGAISRSRPAQDLKELRDDLSWQGLAMIPLGGSMLSSAIKGFTGTNVISLEALGALQQVAYNANKAEWDKLGKASLRLGAYGAGIPYSQPKRTIEGIIDLASNKSDDWMRLIWSEWAREEATKGESKFRGMRELPTVDRGAESIESFLGEVKGWREQREVVPQEREVGVNRYLGEVQGWRERR